MKQEFNGHVDGGVAGRDITHNHFKAIACPGTQACPYERDEAERQRRFEERTGIVCSSGARQAIEHLLDSGVFHYKQVALAWRQRTLWWDWNKHELNASMSRLDLSYGYLLMWGGIAFFILTFGGLLWLRGRYPLNAESVQILVAGVLSLTAAPFAEKYMVRPSHIARRAKPLLDTFYRTPCTDAGIRDVAQVDA